MLGLSGDLIAFETFNNSGISYYVPFWDSQELVLVGRTVLLHAYMVDLINRYISPGMKIIDGGANLGAFTLAAAKRLQGRGHLVAFEPDFRNRQALTQSVRKSGLVDVVTIEPAALCARQGEVSFWMSDVHGALSSITKRSDTDVESVVSGVALDEYLEENFGNHRVDFIKLDLEGGEADALLGMSKVLSQLNVLVLEVNAPQLSIVDKDPMAMAIDYFRAWGYGRIFIGNDLTGQVAPWSHTLFKQTLSDCQFLNLICLRD